jgi:hypothetical protein
MNVGSVIPVPRIFDEDKAREFYVDFLGFAIDWEHRFEAGTPGSADLQRRVCHAPLGTLW